LSIKHSRKTADEPVVKSLFSYFTQHTIQRFPLRLVFSLPFMAQFLLASSLIVSILFYGGQEAIESLMKQMRQEVLERVHEQLDRHMREPVRLNRLNAEAWRMGLLDLSDQGIRERYFFNNIRAFPDAAMTFVGLADGSFYGARRKMSGEVQVVRNNRETGGDSWYYTVSEKGEAVDRQEVFRSFDPRTRPWYEAAQRVGGPTFSGIYRHFIFLEPTITATHPIFNAEGRLIGVFGVDYLLSWLGETLRGLPIGPSGQVFITDSEGFLVAASVLSSPFQEGQNERIRAIDSSNQVLQQAAKPLSDQAASGSYEFKLEDHSYFVDARHFKEGGLDWNIYIVLASDDFLGDIHKAVYRTMLVTLVVILAVFFMAVWTSGWVVRPILRLNSAARELAEGRLQPVPDIERQDELGELSRSFNKMARQLTDLVTNLELRVAERTQQLAEKTTAEHEMREKLYAELAKAGRGQQAMLPEDIEQPLLRLKTISKPYMLVSGDFCSYHWTKENTVLFGYLIDVTGHGLATALQTAAINVMIQEIIHMNYSLSDVMGELNRRVARYFNDDLLVAAFCFEVDLEKGELRYTAAGITEFYIDAAAVTGRVKTPGWFLGVSEQAQFEVHTLPLQSGDCFCFYSDGIADLLVEGREFPGGMVFSDLVEAAVQLAEDGVWRDDATVMCIEICKGFSEEIR
jgi:serine phosphatase RsbU (regulator of sigma subunit)